MAQNYAARCKFQHNPDRTGSQTTFCYVGENIFVGSGSVDYTSVVKAWYKEGQDYNYETNKCVCVCVCAQTDGCMCIFVEKLGFAYGNMHAVYT